MRLRRKCYEGEGRGRGGEGRGWGGEELGEISVAMGKERALGRSSSCTAFWSTEGRGPRREALLWVLIPPPAHPHTFTPHTFTPHILTPSRLAPFCIESTFSCHLRTSLLHFLHIATPHTCISLKFLISALHHPTTSSHLHPPTLPPHTLPLHTLTPSQPLPCSCSPHPHTSQGWRRPRE